MNMKKKRQSNTKHHIMMLNVGQGDAFVCYLASKEVIVIDCHRKHDVTIPPTIKVLEKIAKDRGNANIDVICLTHPHYDHFAGMYEVFKWCKDNGGKIGKLVIYLGLDPKIINRQIKEEGDKYTKNGSDVIAEFMKLKKEFKRFTKENHSFNTILGVGNQQILNGKDSNGNEYSVDVVGPLGPTVQNNIEKPLRRLIRDMHKGATYDEDDYGDEINDTSCLLSILCNNCGILFTGDSSLGIIRDAWNGHIRDSAHKTIEIIKMPHHGSRGKSSEWGKNKKMWSQLLEAKAVALLSYGYDNRYGHPHKELLNMLKSNDIRTVSSNPCESCPQQSQGKDDIDDIIYDEEVLVDSQNEAIHLTIEANGKVEPIVNDIGRKCKLCNSITFLS